jgi:hypothetical protein
MELVGALSNSEIQEQLRRLSQKLALVETGRAQPRPSKFERKRRPGAVADAIDEVLRGSDVPMRMYEIHAAVEARLAEPVPRSTVKDCLANNCRDAGGRFVRLARGRYRLPIPF